MKLIVLMLSALVLSTSAVSAPFQATIGSVQVTEGDRAVLLEAQQYGLDQQQKLPANTVEINSLPTDSTVVDAVPSNSVGIITNEGLDSFNQ